MNVNNKDDSLNKYRILLAVIIVLLAGLLVVAFFFTRNRTRNDSEDNGEDEQTATVEQTTVTPELAGDNVDIDDIINAGGDNSENGAAADGSSGSDGTTLPGLSTQTDASGSSNNADEQVSSGLANSGANTEEGFGQIFY